MRCLTVLFLLCILFYSTQASFEFPTPQVDPVTDFTYNGIAVYNPTLNALQVLTDEYYSLGAVYYNQKQLVSRSFALDFTYSFDFIERPGDGFAVVIQNYEAGAVYGAGQLLGYNFPNNIALEFDTYQNFEPNGNHISLHYAGNPTEPNYWDESYSIASNYDLPVTIGVDQTLQNFRLVYDNVKGIFTCLLVENFGDEYGTIIFSTQSGYFIDQMLSLDQGKAWIGFTSASGSETSKLYITHYQIRENYEVPDFFPMMVICPHDLVIMANKGTCTYSGSTGNPSIVDSGSDVGTATYTRSPRAPYGIGFHLVTFIAHNPGTGNSGSCIQQVQVVAPPGCAASPQ